MPTVAGWQLLIISLAAFAAGRAFGLLEMYAVGATGAAAVTAALAARALHPSRLVVRRTRSVMLLAAGSQAVVSLEIANRSRLRSPSVVLRDRIAGPHGAIETRLEVAPMAGRSSASRSAPPVSGRYTVTAERRGVLQIGPIRLDDQDPLGLARRSRQLDVRSRVIVHPPLEDLSFATAPRGDDPMSGEQMHWTLRQTADDFDTLRGYVSGDDPRHIHWPSTARLDELMVRQYRPALQGQVIVVLDTRPPGDAEAAQDCTTSVAASVVLASLTAGDQARIITTDGRVTPTLHSLSDMPTALEFCAALSGGGEYAADTVSKVAGVRSMVVAVTASPDTADRPAARHHLMRTLGASLLISCDAARWNAPAAAQSSVAAGDWLHLTGAGQLRDLWAATRRGGCHSRRGASVSA